MFHRERGEDLARVIADRGKTEPSRANLGKRTLQLDELRAAVRSPVGRPEEHEHRALRTGEARKAVRAAVLIDQGKGRRGRADRRPDAGHVDRCRGPRLSQHEDETCEDEAHGRILAR